LVNGIKRKGLGDLLFFERDGALALFGSSFSLNFSSQKVSSQKVMKPKNEIRR